MFPSTGSFRFMHCPYHSEGHCGRIYCHFRHVKTREKQTDENEELSALEKSICNALKIDKETFNILLDEEDDNVHEKLVNNKLKNLFPDQRILIDNLRFPEPTHDLEFSSTPLSANNDSKKLTSLTDDTPLDEGPLKQFLEEDAKRNPDSEHKNRNTLEKRHILISCLEKIDKRENSRRPIVQRKPPSNAVLNSNNSKTTIVNPDENTDDIATQPIYKNNLNLKQEDMSDSSESEDNAEVDKILTQMELLNPQLFNTEHFESLKNEPVDFNYDLGSSTSNDLPPDEDLNSQATVYIPKDSKPTSSTTSSENRKGRINLKSIAAINNEISSHNKSANVKPEVVCQPVDAVADFTAPDPIMLAATIAEQNRLKNLFKNTICSNIDQFFDFSDACKVYGTEIFNLLEPLLNYLIDKLNPEFNFEKLQRLREQNMSLSCALPFVMACDHAKHCIECNNILTVAMSRTKLKTANKATETSPSLLSTSNDTPLRKIEAGLYDITKEMLSLGIPVENHLPDKPKTEMKNVQCQTEKNDRHSSHQRSSRDRHHRDSKNSKGERHSKSEERLKSRKHHSSSRHSHGERHSSKSGSSHKHEKRKKENIVESSGDEYGKKQKSSSKSEDSHRRKRSSTDKSSSVEVKKPKIDVKSKADHHADVKNSENDDESDDEVDVFGAALSDGYSDSESEGGSKSIENGRSRSSSPKALNNDDSGNEEGNSNEFVDRFPTLPNKKRVSHVNESNSSQVYRKTVLKKHIPKPAEVMHQRLLNKKAEETSLFNTVGSTNEKIRISHVPNVALMLEAKERMKNNVMVHKQNPLPVRTIAQTAHRGNRVAHAPAEEPKPKDVPLQAHLTRPKIKEFKSSHNIPLHIRQTGLDKLYNAFAKKVPADMASELALKEEQTIHEKVTIQKIYLNSLAMAVHRIMKENPAKLLEKNTEFPLEINGSSVYDILTKHVLTYEQLEINGFPLAIPSKPGCCRISTKAVHYKPLSSKRSGDRFYCQQCKELFDMDPETGLPITPMTGCRFHTMRPRKEAGRLRHELYYPCCNSSISESGCMSSEYHTPDMLDDDCLEGFVETRAAPPGEQGKRFYSFDCEMCYTTVGAELTRVTVIGHDCNVIYDSLVKPRNQILDYCTKFSGITEEKLRRVTKTLEDVRQDLMKFMLKDSILIGHSLENDLKALKIIHYKIVDTSVMYPHRDAPERKFSLKYLASNHVQYLIQESEFGHDSKEDALACMRLVWKKIREDAQSFRPKKIISSPLKPA